MKTMKYRTLVLLIISAILIPLKSNAINLGIPTEREFNKEKDLLLVHFDCKTDVDDLHSVAALVTLMSHSDFSEIQYHAVAGTYGIQEGLYVPPNDLFQLAFGDNWTDANENLSNAVEKVKTIALRTLTIKGDVWIAEAGQSDFTAKLIREIQLELPNLNVSEHIHIVQHSDWNEKVTSPVNLQFVKEHADYHKIPDGNAIGNGTPGFRTPNLSYWEEKVVDPTLMEVWQLATDIANKYNGKDGRYNNEAIAAGGLDFSDLSEVCWILGLKRIKDTQEFFNTYSY